MIHSPEYYLGRFGVTVAGIINDHQPITYGHRADPLRVGHDVNIPDDRQLDNEAETNFRIEIEQAYPNSGLISMVSCLPYDRQWTVQEIFLALYTRQQRERIAKRTGEHMEANPLMISCFTVKFFP